MFFYIYVMDFFSSSLHGIVSCVFWRFVESSAAATS